jgi:hypothetical protein
MRRLLLVLLAVSSAGAAGQAVHPNVTPGLWESTTTTKVTGDMPPAVASAMTRTVTSRSCVTEQGLAQDLARSQMQRQGQCTLSNTQMASEKYTTDIACGTAMTGHMEMWFDSASSAHWTTQMATNMAGHTMQMESSAQSKLISGDCGSLEPGHSQVVQ